MVNPDPVFLKTITDALSEYKQIAISHSVDPTRKVRMLALVSQVEALVRGSSTANRDIYQQQIKPKINQLIDDLMALSPVSARPGTGKIVNQDDVRKREDYWVLDRKAGGLYQVCNPTKTSVQTANGGYVFVVLVSCPWEVRLGMRATGGHTAISRGADVYFAGEIFFSQGVLQKWNNDSGHYKPHTSLHLQVRNLLPVDKYEAR